MRTNAKKFARPCKGKWRRDGSLRTDQLQTQTDESAIGGMPPFQVQNQHFLFGSFCVFREPDFAAPEAIGGFTPPNFHVRKRRDTHPVSDHCPPDQ
jgi:hypothetical protein